MDCRGLRLSAQLAGNRVELRVAVESFATEVGVSRIIVRRSHISRQGCPQFVSVPVGDGGEVQLSPRFVRGGPPGNLVALACLQGAVAARVGAEVARRGVVLLVRHPHNDAGLLGLVRQRGPHLGAHLVGHSGGGHRCREPGDRGRVAALRHRPPRHGGSGRERHVGPVNGTAVGDCHVLAVAGAHRSEPVTLLEGQLSAELMVADRGVGEVGRTLHHCDSAERCLVR